MNRLKELRKEKKLTQKELAQELGIHYRTLQNWENNETQIKPDKAEALASYFDVSIGHLLGFTNNRTVQDELVQSHEEIQKQFQKETDALLSIGELLSDRDINSVLDFIRELSIKNKEVILTKIENDDEFLNDYFESEFFLFSEKHPNYIKEKHKEHKEYMQQISTMTEDERKLIALHLNEIYSKVERRI